MPEDSGASLSLGPEPAVSLPPRKRLLAGLKQSGWSSPSSSSSSSSSSSLSMPHEFQVKSILLHEDISELKSGSEIVDVAIGKKNRSLSELQAESSPFRECPVENKDTKSGRLDAEDLARKADALAVEKRRNTPHNIAVRHREVFSEEYEVPDDVVVRNRKAFDEMLGREKGEAFLAETTVSDNHSSQEQKYKRQNFRPLTETAARKKMKESDMHDTNDSPPEKDLEVKRSSQSSVTTLMKMKEHVENVGEMETRVLNDIKQVSLADMGLLEPASTMKRLNAIIKPEELNRNTKADVEVWSAEKVRYNKAKTFSVNDVKASPGEKDSLQKIPSKHQILGSLIGPAYNTKKIILNDIKTLSAEMDLKENPSNLSSSLRHIKKAKRSVESEVKNSPTEKDVKETPLNLRAKKVKERIVNDADDSPAEKNPNDKMNLSANPSSVRSKEVRRGVVNVTPTEKDLKENLESQDNPSSLRTKKLKECAITDVREPPEKLEYKHENGPLVKDEAITVEEAIASVKSHGPTDNSFSLKPRDGPEQEKTIADGQMSMENVYDRAFNPRRNPSRENHSKAAYLFKKQEGQLRKSSNMMPSLSDEELARQLHRAMNSSPRISRCHSQDLKLFLL